MLVDLFVKDCKLLFILKDSQLQAQAELSEKTAKIVAKLQSSANSYVNNQLRNVWSSKKRIEPHKFHFDVKMLLSRGYASFDQGTCHSMALVVSSFPTGHPIRYCRHLAQNIITGFVPFFRNKFQGLFQEFSRT